MQKDCLSDEKIASYVEGCLKAGDLVIVQDHLRGCSLCSEIVEVQKACVLARERGDFVTAPPDLYNRLREELVDPAPVQLLEILITFKEKIFEAIRTTGEFLPSLSVTPAYVLRGTTGSADFAVIRETFGTVQVLVEVSRTGKDGFKVLLKTADVQSTLPREDLRVNLLQGSTELESYKTSGGRVIFEPLKPGDYLLEITTKDSLIGNIKLGMKGL